MRKILLIVVLALLSAPMWAQVSNPDVKYVPVAPSGSCPAHALPVQVSYSNEICTCGAGTWSCNSGGGTGGPFLPLAGGTLTGPLNGTDGNFSGTIAAGTTNPVAIGGATGSCTGKYANADGTGCSTATEITNGQPISPSSVTTSSFLYQPGGLVNVRQYGAVCDGSTHPLSGTYGTLAAAQVVYPFVTALTQETDYAGIQKTINSLTVAPWSSGNILIPAGCLINTTVVIDSASIGVQGDGWGVSLSTVGSYLKWDGTAGTPMLKLINAWGSRIANLRFIGDSANKPSAAINFNQQINIPDNQNAVDNIYIGNLAALDADSGTEFTNGILFDGIDLSDSLSVIRNTIISGTVNGINLTQAQNSINYIESLQVNNATGCGIRSASQINGGNLYLANNGVDLCAVASADSASGYGFFTFQNLLSEGSGRLLTTVATESGLVVTGSGSWGVTASIAGDAKVIYSSNQAGRETIDLNNFTFPNIGSATVPLIDMETASGSTYAIKLHNAGAMPFSSITCTSPTGCDIFLDGPLGSLRYQGATTGGYNSQSYLFGPNLSAYNQANYQNANLGVYAQGGTACMPFSNSNYNAALQIWEWCAAAPDALPDAGTAGALTLQYQTNGGGWITAATFARNGGISWASTHTFAAESAYAGYAMCYTTGGLQGHCTSVLGVGGTCTCVSP
jgi:hypothetical protein